MTAITVGVELSECEVTPVALAAETERPWCVIEITPRRLEGTASPGTVVQLTVNGPDDVERLIAACGIALGVFERQSVTA